MEWGKFRIGGENGLFEVKTVKSFDEGKIKLFEKKKNNYFEFIGRTRNNNGIKGYVEKLGIEPNPENIISVSQIGTIVAQIRNTKWYASQNIFSLSPKKPYENLISLFGVSAINKSLNGSFSDGYGNYPTLEKLANLEIFLPTKNGKIDFEFMESVIEELENEKIEKLNNFLLATGLKDYNLNEKEIEVLHDFESGKFEWGEFSIVNDIFDVKNAGNILSRDIIENSGNIPYLCASAENNGISSYISYDKKYLDKGNCIFIGGKTFVVSYQEKDFYSNDSHNLVLHLKGEEKKNKLNYLFLVSCVNKSLGYKYSWGDSISNKKIQKDNIQLPIKNNSPDFELMETLISAVQKLVIKDVVLYADRKIKIG